MPLYLYQCSRCGHRFEELVRTAAATATAVACPDCRGHDVERLPTTFNVGARAAAKPADPPFCGRCGENRPPCDG